MKSGRYVASLKRLGMVDRARNVSLCGETLTFKVNPETGRQKLAGALFCKDRLCPLCAWRRTVKTFRQVSRVMDAVQQEQPQLVPLFLTLSIRNVAGDTLPATLDTILKGWNLLMKQRKAERAVQGWFRALEVTYDKDETISAQRYKRNPAMYDRKGLKPGDANPNYDTFHPHIHAILLVDAGYFSSKDYMETTEWVRLWRMCCKLDYDPVSDIRRVKAMSEKQKAKAVAEVAKYTVKDSDYLTADDAVTDKLVLVLGEALHRRRLLAMGGVMATTAKRLAVDIESQDLVNLDGEDMRPDVAVQLVTYRWNIGQSNYFQMD